MSEYTNNLNVVSTYKGEKSVSITGTFQCGIHFPKSGAKPFKVIERTSKNNKQYKQIACTVVISPDDRKNNNGNPFSSVYYDGKYLTFKEFLETTGVELIKGKLYAWRVHGPQHDGSVSGHGRPQFDLQAEHRSLRRTVRLYG